MWLPWKEVDFGEPGVLGLQTTGVPGPGECSVLACFTQQEVRSGQELQ